MTGMTLRIANCHDQSVIPVILNSFQDCFRICWHTFSIFARAELFAKGSPASADEVLHLT
jgi:hypothetical protein